MIKSIFVWLWYVLFVNPFTEYANYIFIVTKDRVGISIFQSLGGVTEFYIHLPASYDLKTTFGPAWSKAKRFCGGKILHGTVNIQLKDIKPGMNIRIFSDEIWMASLPLEIVSVFHDSDTSITWTIKDIISKTDSRIASKLICSEQNRDHTSVLSTYLLLCHSYHDGLVPYNTLISVICQDKNLNTVSAHKLIEELVVANLLFIVDDERHEKVKPSVALIHLLQTNLKK